MDPISELAALEASSLASMTAAQPAEQAPAVAPDAPAAGEVVIQVSSAAQLQQIQQQMQQPPVAPTEPAATIPAAPAAPAPTTPDVVVPSETPRRVYAHEGMSEDNKLLLGLIQNNPDLKLETIVAAAASQLGRTITPPVHSPAPPPAEPSNQAPATPAAQPQTITLDAANARLEAIDAELTELDPVLDVDKWKSLSLEASKLNRQLPHLIATQQQEEIEQQTLIRQTVDASQAQVAERYPQINRQVFDTAFDTTKSISGIADPFAQAVAARIRNDVANNSPMLDAPDYELLVTAAIAQEHGITPARKATPPAPQAPAAPNAQPAPAAPPPAGPAPLTVMPAVPGSQHTSADRVTTTPANPQADINAQYQQAVAAGDFAAIERLSGIMSAGPQAQFAMPPQIIGISVTATPGA